MYYHNKNGQFSAKNVFFFEKNDTNIPNGNKENRKIRGAV